MLAIPLKGRVFGWRNFVLIFLRDLMSKRIRTIYVKLGYKKGYDLVYFLGMYIYSLSSYLLTRIG